VHIKSPEDDIILGYNLLHSSPYKSKNWSQWSLVKCGEFAILGVFLYDYRQKMRTPEYR
jgi:hypothetical protein